MMSIPLAVSLTALTSRGVVADGERVGVRGGLRVLDAAIPVGHPDAYGVVEVGQVVGVGAVHRGAEVETLDVASLGREVLEAADGC